MKAGGILYLILFLLVWWSCQGYIIYLYYFSRKSKANHFSEKKFFFSIIVPTFNEKEWVAGKIASLSNLTYQRQEILFADASNDGTQELITRFSVGNSRIRLVKSESAGRSQQINAALAKAKGDIILISDCDGVLPSDALEKFNAYFQDESVGLVGASVMPQTGGKLEAGYWQSQNSIRFLESDYGNCPAVSGVGYAFRRSLLDFLPGQVWADDIYLPLLANTRGLFSLYTKTISAYELRAPAKLKELIFHKARKTQDYLKELLRFLPEIWVMPGCWRVVYLSRCVQLWLLPWLFMPVVFFWFYQSPGFKLYSICIVGLSGVIQGFILKKQFYPDKTVSFMRVLAVFLFTNMVLLIALVQYGLNRGKITYAKVR